MDYELRPVTRDEIGAFVRTDLAAFGEGKPDPARMELEWTNLELDRTLAAFDGGEIVGTGRLFSFELTLPGLATLPVAAVSWIGVLPTHRRRGILTAIKRRQLDDAAERGECMAVLLASEGLIYRRFGYGIASTWMTAELERRHSAFLHPVTTGGRVRLVDEDTARKVLPELFDRARRVQPGAVQRVDAWWADQFFWREREGLGGRFFAVYEAPGGTLDAYVAYRIEKRWENVARNTLVVDDMVSVTPQARAVLWRYVCDVDLIETIRAFPIPVDDPLRWLLVEFRRLRVTRLGDGLWVRLLDVPAALTARSYSGSGRVVFDVHDAFRPEGGAAGRFALEAGPEGATATHTNAEPDLVLGVADLGAAYLGGVSFSALARAGLIEERIPGALSRADVMFRSEPQPYAMTWF